jgi:hypothetical protein
MVTVAIMRRQWPKGSAVKKTATCALLLFPLALGGCGLVQQAKYARAREQLAAAEAACKAQHPNSLLDQSGCLTAAENSIERPVIQDGDLLTLLQAKRELLGLRVGRGEITRSEADVELAQVTAEIKDEELARANASRAVAAQQSIASAQMAAAAARLLQPQQPAPYYAPPMVNMNCTRMGAFTNCTGN